MWRPRASSSRIALTVATSSPAMTLRSVDLPTPDEPMNATVRPGSISDRTAPTPRPSTAEAVMIRTPTAIRSTSAMLSAASSARSAFERTMTGSAPLSQATAR